MTTYSSTIKVGELERAVFIKALDKFREVCEEKINGGERKPYEGYLKEIEKLFCQLYTNMELASYYSSIGHGDFKGLSYFKRKINPNINLDELDEGQRKEVEVLCKEMIESAKENCASQKNIAENKLQEWDKIIKKYNINNLEDIEDLLFLVINKDKNE